MTIPRGAVEQARMKNPCATLEQIGQKFGVSRERIRQILQRANLPTRRFVQHNFICLQCGKEFTCKWPRRFCSPECSRRYHNPSLVCSECGILFERRLKTILHNNGARGYKGRGMWCSKQCFGKWFGNNYGFSAHPENIPRGSRKWDRTSILHLRLDTGWGAPRISRALGIPQATVGLYLKRN